MKIKTILVFLLIYTTGFSQENKETDLNSGRLKRIDDFFYELTSNGKLSGVSTMISRDNQILYQKSFGYLDIESETKYSKNTLAHLPIKKDSTYDQILILVVHILAITKTADYLNNPAKQAQVREYERQIDRMVYNLYGLTEEEIRIVEGETK